MPLIHTSRLPQGAKFSQQRADKVIRFIEETTVHTKSSYAHSGGKCTFRKMREKAHCYDKHFILEPWQKGRAFRDENNEWAFEGILTPLFGAVRWSEKNQCYVRQFREAWLEMARKNGKSEIMAALGLYLLISDGEQSAEIYGAASDKDQAAMVFDVARDMIYLSPVLRRLKDKGDIEIIDSRKRIVYTPTRSFYRVVAADAAGNLGANPHGILFDEVLAQPNSDLWNYLRQGFGTRPQPMLIGVTTAGPNDKSFAFEEHEHGIKIGQDPDKDKKRFVFMAFTDEKEDWKDTTKWGEANPALSTNGGFLDIDFLIGEMEEAITKGDLSKAAAFKIFHLNQWGVSSDRWLDMEVWDESEASHNWVLGQDTAGIHAIAGLDMAETMDFTSWVLVWYDESHNRVMIKPHFWLTKKALTIRHGKRAEKMQEWIDAGYITLFNADVHNQDKMREHMLSDIAEYGVQLLGYDPFQAAGIISHLEDHSSVTAIKVPQTTTRMNPGSQELVNVMGTRMLTSNQNPVLRWQAENAAYKTDAEGHIKPHRETSDGNIDGIVALVNAFTVFVTEPVPGGDFYAFEDDELNDLLGDDDDD